MLVVLKLAPGGPPALHILVLSLNCCSYNKSVLFLMHDRKVSSSVTGQAELLIFIDYNHNENTTCTVYLTHMHNTFCMGGAVVSVSYFHRKPTVHCASLLPFPLHQWTYTQILLTYLPAWLRCSVTSLAKTFSDQHHHLINYVWFVLMPSM